MTECNVAFPASVHNFMQLVRDFMLTVCVLVSVHGLAISRIVCQHVGQCKGSVGVLCAFSCLHMFLQHCLNGAGMVQESCPSLAECSSTFLLVGIKPETWLLAPKPPANTFIPFYSRLRQNEWEL